MAFIHQLLSTHLVSEVGGFPNQELLRRATELSALPQSWKDYFCWHTLSRSVFNYGYKI